MRRMLTRGRLEAIVRPRGEEIMALELKLQVLAECDECATPSVEVYYGDLMGLHQEKDEIASETLEDLAARGWGVERVSYEEIALYSPK